MIYQQLQPINDQQQPVQISPEYTFTSPPQIKCLYHSQIITHFCKKTSCLLPLCQTCQQNHPIQHSKYIDNIQDTLNQVYSGYAKRANEIAIHQRNDILKLHQDLHKLIDAIFQDLLKKADQNYQNDLVVEWRNLISKLEKLKDSHTCIKQTIHYFLEPDQGYHQPQLTYQNIPIKIDQFQLQQAKFHLNRLFTVDMNNGEQYHLRDDEYYEDNHIRRVSSRLEDQNVYQLYNYTDNPKQQHHSASSNNQNDRSPIRLITPIDQQYTIQSPLGIAPVQPLVRTPYTVPSIYTISTVRQFNQSRELTSAFPFVQ